MADRLMSVGSEINPVNLEHPTLAFLRSYWDAKRGERMMPSRTDIKPSELREHLGWVNMAEVMPGMEDFRFRLVGTLVTQYFLRDATGKTISEAFAPAGEGAIKGVKAIFRKTARDKVPMRVFGDAGWIAIAVTSNSIPSICRCRTTARPVTSCSMRSSSTGRAC